MSGDFEREVSRWIAFALGVTCSLAAAYCNESGFALLIFAYTTREHLTSSTGATREP